MLALGSLPGIVGLALGFLASNTLYYGNRVHGMSQESRDYCAVPLTRREWRTLSFLEKSDFIHAVRCMAYEPSKARPKGALFDDFPYARAQLGHRSKSPAPS